VGIKKKQTVVLRERTLAGERCGLSQEKRRRERFAQKIYVVPVAKFR
jgi:hypothetical protein